MICTRGVRNVSFSGKFAYVRNGWPKKAFDYLDHIVFLFPSWKSMVLKKCVINGGATTQYFNSERGTRQEDSVSAYLFIPVLEILFLLIKGIKGIKGTKIFEHCFF